MQLISLTAALAASFLPNMSVPPSRPLLYMTDDLLEL